MYVFALVSDENTKSFLEKLGFKKSLAPGQGVPLPNNVFVLDFEELPDAIMKMMSIDFKEVFREFLQSVESEKLYDFFVRYLGWKSSRPLILVKSEDARLAAGREVKRFSGSVIATREPNIRPLV